MIQALNLTGEAADAFRHAAALAHVPAELREQVAYLAGHMASCQQRERNATMLALAMAAMPGIFIDKAQILGFISDPLMPHTEDAARTYLLQGQLAKPLAGEPER
jgi:hypothetical protein